ncbi:MAG TPA: hypothetical protein VGI99_15435 [Gemmataceae bacterium]
MNVTKAAKCSVWLTFAGVMAIGCSPLSTLGFIFRDDPKVAAKYPLHPKDATDKEKSKEATVLILCDQRDGLPRELAGAYIELADNMNRQLPEMTKANKEKIKMVEEKALANYQKRHPDWRTLEPAQIGKALKADCVIHVYVASANFYDPNTAKMMYKGKANVECKITYLSDGKDPEVRRYSHHFDYKPHRSPDADETSESLYRQQYLEQLATELCWYHVEHPKRDTLE